MQTRSRPEKLSFLVGGKAKLAEICEVSPALVTRWCKRGWIEMKYNIRVKRWVAKRLGEGDVKNPVEFAAEIEACLEKNEICKCCGQPIEGRRAI